MSREQDEKLLQKKLDEIRERLMASPNQTELRALQLQMEVLGLWARLARLPSADQHDHDHMDDHDHAALPEVGIAVSQVERG